MSPPTTPAESVTLAEMESEPHPALARLRATAPACWVPVLGAWLVTGYDLAVEVLRDSRTFTVDDPRFSTAKVVGPSMLSLDGARHARHRAPFTRPFRSSTGQLEIVRTDRRLIPPAIEESLRLESAAALVISLA